MRIAVVGSGISGNIFARSMSAEHDVVLYEKRDRLGGHTATKTVDYDGTEISVDTGFIVYNIRNYPNLTALFDHFGVQTENTDMSFSVSLAGGKLEWAGGRGINSLLAQPENVFSLGFLRMLRSIPKFNAQATSDLLNGELGDESLGEYLRRLGFSQRFIGHYVVPMGAAIWSTPADKLLDYPAKSFLSFFENHQLLRIRQEGWLTVSGGSKTYLDKLFEGWRGEIRLSSQIVDVKRSPEAVTLTDINGNSDTFDALVIAAHSDQALEMLGSEASQAEQAILGKIRYRDNMVYLHRDPSHMPKRKRAWAAWNFMTTSSDVGPDPKTGEIEKGGHLCVSYWMNRLQNINEKWPLFVTLNPDMAPDPDLTFGSYVYAHPQYDAEALAAQQQLSTIQGQNNTWFCGAYFGHGFHEDGLKSGVDIVRALNGKVPWDEASLSSSPDMSKDAA